MGEFESSTKLAADSLSVEQKECLHEIANELLNIYQTLVNMRYVDPKALIRGPHETSDKLLSSYAKFELDPAIIYLYSIMPYIDEAETDARDFFQGGDFFNQMSIPDVQIGRDPRYLLPAGSFDDEHGQYMYPWYTPLSNCGNHSPIIIYDAKEHRIWIVDQIDGCTTDPAYCKGWYGESDSVRDEPSNWGDSSSGDWSGNSGADDELNSSDDGSQGSSEFWDDEDNIGETRELVAMVEDQSEVIEYDEGFEHVEELQEWERQEAAAVNNRNSLESVRSRPAGDVLREINQLYRGLKELPGLGEYKHWVEPAILRRLYIKNGWQDHFDGDQFEVDVARAYATERARYFAEEPMRQADCYSGWAKLSDQECERYKKEIAEAQTPDDEWTARFELWKAEERSEGNANDLRKAKEQAEKMCPGGVCQKEDDLPLWQLEQIRVETQGKRESAQRKDHVNFAEQFKDNPEQIRRIEAQHRRTKRELEVLEEAFAATMSEAERLCPGRSFREATGIKSLGPQDLLASIASEKEGIKSLEDYIRSVRGFGDIVPRTAPAAIAAVEIEIQKHEKLLVGSQKSLEQSER